MTFKEGKGTSFKLKTHLNGMRKLREGGEITEPLCKKVIGETFYRVEQFLQGDTVKRVN